MPVVTLASALRRAEPRPAAGEGQRTSERASGGGERSPINSRWIFAADGDLQHISTQRTRAPPTRSRTMTLPVKEVQFQTRYHNMTEGREHPPTNKHSPPAPTSPFTPGRPIYLSLSLPHTLLRPIFQLFILFPSKSLSPFLISDNGHFGRLMRPVSAVGPTDRPTAQVPTAPRARGQGEKTPIRYSPPRRRRRLSLSSAAAAAFDHSDLSGRVAATAAAK